jgi:hypothetical protein
MTIELSWLVPDTTLLSHWIDLSDCRHINDDAVYHYFRSPIPRHPRRGRIALVGASFHSQALADVLNRVSHHEMFQAFDSRHEARAFLLHHDTPPPSLPSPPQANR